MSSAKDKAAATGMYVILGSSGNTGSIIADFLLSKGQKVRVVGRDPGRLQRFVRKGAEAFAADLTDAAGLTKAFTPSLVRVLGICCCRRYIPERSKSDRAMQSRKA